MTRNPAGVFSLLFLALCVCSCSSTKDLLVHTAPVNIERPACRPALPAPDPIKTYPVMWNVMSYGNPPEPYFVLSAKDYQNLSLSVADTRRWVDEAAGQLRYYQKEDQP